jgi:hypothetical protein
VSDTIRVRNARSSTVYTVQASDESTTKQQNSTYLSPVECNLVVFLGFGLG